tara:strand:- start:7 stop:1188 length:1182 start_codon:yes stop_codon:yes gene_type:complete
MNNLFIFEDSGLRSYGGGQSVTINILECLNKNKLKIHLFDSSKTSKFQEILNHKKFNFIKRRYYKLQNNHNKNPKNNKSSFTVPFHKALIEFFTTFIPEIFKLRNYKYYPEKIITPNKKTFVLAILYSIIIKKPKSIIFYHHSFYPKSFFANIFVKSLYYFSKLNKSIEIVNIFVSNFTAHSFLKKIPSDNLFVNYVLYNSTPNEKKLIQLRKNIEKNKFKNQITISIFSALIPWKGVLDSIKIYANISLDVRKKYKLNIYGSGKLEKEIIKISKNTFGCKFRGFKTSLEMAKETDILILPSLAEESCPISAIEAICAGIPTFSLAFGGQNEILKPINLLIKNPKNINLLFQEIINKNNEDLIKISTKAINLYNQNFTSEKYSDKLNYIILGK